MDETGGTAMDPAALGSLGKADLHTLSLVISQGGNLQFKFYVHTPSPDQPDTHQHAVSCSGCSLKCLSHSEMVDILVNSDLQDGAKAEVDCYSDTDDFLDQDSCFACSSCNFLTYSSERLEKHTAQEHPDLAPESVYQTKVTPKTVSTRVRLADFLFFFCLSSENSGNSVNSPTPGSQDEQGVTTKSSVPNDYACGMVCKREDQCIGQNEYGAMEGLTPYPGSVPGGDNIAEMSEASSSLQQLGFSSHETEKHIRQVYPIAPRKLDHDDVEDNLMETESNRGLPQVQLKTLENELKERQGTISSGASPVLPQKKNPTSAENSHRWPGIGPPRKRKKKAGPTVSTPCSSSALSSLSTLLRSRETDKSMESCQVKKSVPGQHPRRKHGTGPRAVDSAGSKDLSNNGGLLTMKTADVGMRSFICETCGRPFSRLINLQAHMDAHSKYELYKCRVCGMAYTSTQNVYQHMIKAHPKKSGVDTTQTASSSSTVAAGGSDSSGKDQSAVDAQTQNDRVESLTSTSSHESNIETVPGVKSPDMSSDAKAGTSLRAPPSASYKIRPTVATVNGRRVMLYGCPVCHRTFEERLYLQAHLKTHRPPEFECPGCKSGFTSKEKLAKHMEDYHKRKKLQCPVCEKWFVEDRVLTRHMQSHPGEKAHKCQVCGRGFNCWRNFQFHMGKHTGVFYECKECPKKFTCKTSLDLHMRLHTGNKLNVCQICGRRFVRKIDFVRHNLTHTGEKPHQCSICGMRFTLLNSQKKHMKTHTGEKPHQCEECGKTFARLNCLQAHMRRHAGLKRHKCDICDKSFFAASDLRRHQRRHSEKTSRIYVQQ